MRKRNVQSKRVSLLLAFIFLSGTAIAAPPRTPEEEAAVQIYATSLRDKLPEFDEPLEQAAVKILREVAASKRSKIGRAIVGARGAQISLLRLGDDQSIEEAVAQFRGYNSRFAWTGLPKAMEWSHQPKLIPYLAEDFFRDEDPTKFISSKRDEGSFEATIVVPPRSVYAGTITMRIITREPAFSDELKEWADKMIDLRFSDVSKFRHTMKGWWVANQDNFKAEEYGKVRPFVLSPLEESPPKPKIEPKAATPTPEPTFAKKPSVPAKEPAEPEAGDAQVDSNPFPWWIFIIGGVVLAGLIIIIRRK